MPIRTSRERADSAVRYIDERPIFQSRNPIKKAEIKKAIMDFLLLEDIQKLINERLEMAKLAPETSELARRAKKANIKKHEGLVCLFNDVIGSTYAILIGGQYNKITSAVRERELVAAATDIARIARLAELAIGLVRDVSADATKTLKIYTGILDGVVDISTHEENEKEVHGLGRAEDAIAEAMSSVEEVSDETVENPDRVKTTGNPLAN